MRNWNQGNIFIYLCKIVGYRSCLFYLFKEIMFTAGCFSKWKVADSFPSTQLIIAAPSQSNLKSEEWTKKKQYLFEKIHMKFMSYLRCQSFQDVAPVTVAVRVEVILKRRVKGHSPRLDTGVTVPADTQALTRTNFFIFIYPQSWVVVVGEYESVSRQHIEPNSLNSPPNVPLSQ